MLYYFSAILLLEALIAIFVFICNTLNLLTILSCITIFFVGWKVMERQNKPYWYGFIPFYNMYEMCEIAFGVGKGWFCILLFLPITNWIMYPIYCNKLREKYGYETLFTVGLILLPFVFLPILVFENEERTIEKENLRHISKMANWYANEATTAKAKAKAKDKDKETREEQILNQTKEAVDESVEENQEKIDIVDKIQEKINEEKDAQDE